MARDKPYAGSGSGTIMGGLKRVMANRQSWYAALLGMFMTAPMLSFTGLWAVPYMTAAYDIDRATSASTLATSFLGWGVGAIALGWLSDRMERRKPLLIVGTALSMLTLTAILYLPGLSLLLVTVLLFLNGFASACMVLTFASARELNALRSSGAAYGLVNTCVVGSGAIFQPLIGYLLDLNWAGQMVEGARLYSVEAFQTAFLILPVCCGISVLCAMLLRETYCRQQVDG